MINKYTNLTEEEKKSFTDELNLPDKQVSMKQFLDDTIESFEQEKAEKRIAEYFTNKAIGENNYDIPL